MLLVYKYCLLIMFLIRVHNNPQRIDIKKMIYLCQIGLKISYDIQFVRKGLIWGVLAFFFFKSPRDQIVLEIIFLVHPWVCVVEALRLSAHMTLLWVNFFDQKSGRNQTVSSPSFKSLIVSLALISSFLIR